MTFIEPGKSPITAWKPLLRAAGLALEGDQVICADRSAAGRAEARMTPLLDRAWLSLGGNDAVEFLHDQLTAGIDDLDDSVVRLAAYCSAQGRVLALLRVTRPDGELLVELPAALAESISRRLGMYVLRADVRIRLQAGITALGIWGNDAPGRLQECSLPAPAGEFQRAATNDLSVTRLPGPHPRYQVTGEIAPVTRCWERWADKTLPATTGEWRALDVLSGLPDVIPETSDQWLPQSLNLEAWNALSFRKGCYPGQEVIARLHYLGRLKRHLYRAAVDGSPPEPGAVIRDGKGNAAGSVAGAGPAPDGDGAVLLAVLREGAAADSRLAGSPDRTLRDAERLTQRPG